MRRTPKDFPLPPSAQIADRTHPVAIAAGSSGSSELPELPGSPELPERSDSERTSRSGEKLRRYTLWLTEADSALLDRLRASITVEGLTGVPDRSAVARECIRRVADSEL